MGISIKESNGIFVINSTSSKTQNISLNIQDSGTAFRFLLARLASIENKKSLLNAGKQLRKRPIQPLIQILEKMNANIDNSDFPIKIIGKKLLGGKIELRGDVSSQFISALLLIAPSYKNDLEIKIINKIISKSYLDLTIRIMKDFGVNVDFNENSLHLKKNQKYINLRKYTVEPDCSSAAYFWALGTIVDTEFYTEISEISAQPDFKFLQILKQMGAEVERVENLLKVSAKSVSGIEVDMGNMPDQVPTLAVLALMADSKTVIKNIAHLKYKESNRIHDLLENIKKLGGNINYKNGNLMIYPLKNRPNKTEIDAFNDHRIAMAFSLLKAKYKDISISGLDAVAKSYPDFQKKFTQIIDKKL